MSQGGTKEPERCFRKTIKADIQILQRAIELDPENPDALCCLGYTLEEQDYIE